MNRQTILQASSQVKSPTLNYQQEPESRNAVQPNLRRELQQLQDIKDRLVELPCSPRVKPIVAKLSEILDLAQDGGSINVERLRILVHAARDGAW